MQSKRAFRWLAAVLAVLALAGAAEPARPRLPPGPSKVVALPSGLKRPYKDRWFSSDVHQRHQGTLVFSRQRIENPQENEALLASSFGRRDPLYARVYLDRSIPNTPVLAPGRRTVFPAEAAHFYRLFVDGRPFDGALGIFWSGLRLSSSEAEDRQTTTWRFEPHPAPMDDRASPEAAVAWARVVNGLAPGNHRLRFELWAGELEQHSRGPRATGELSLAVGPADFLRAGVAAPADGYLARDRDRVKESIRKLLAQAKPPLSTEHLALKRVWAEKVGGESGASMRRILAIARTAKDPRGRVCEYRGFLVRQERTGGRWGKMKLEAACPLPECAPSWADCE